MKPIRGIQVALAFLLSLSWAGVSSAAISNGAIVDVNRFGPQTVDGHYANNDPTFGGSLLGGEFRITDPYNASPMGSAATLNIFKTFCLEYSEHISLGGNYKATINAGAIQGGYTGGAPGGMDELSGATKWLYNAYRSDVLDDWSDFEYDNNAWADALQLVFWRLEGEVSMTSWALNDGANSAIYGLSSDIANKATSLWINFVTPNSTWLDAYSTAQVKVLNLWDSSATLDYTALDTDAAYRNSAYITGVKRQSQLYMDGEPSILPPTAHMPEPISLVVWGVMGGMGLAAFHCRRRLAARRQAAGPSA